MKTGPGFDYPAGVTRKLYILLTALLVATHAFAVPWHVALEHGMGRVYDGDEGGFLHAIGAEYSPSHHHGDIGGTPCPPELFDASNYGPPHHHPGHAHSATDHSFARKRTAPISATPLAMVPQLEQFFHPSAAAFVCADTDSPASPPRVSTACLRGPPVC